MCSRHACWGWAQILSGRVEEGRATLEPIATQDPYAAYKLAKLAQEQGGRHRGGALCARAHIRFRAGGRARTLLNELGLLLTTQPAGSEYPAVPAVLATFQPRRERVLPINAGVPVRQHGTRTSEPDSRRALGWAKFSISNTGSFPITLGPDAMVNPVFLLSFVMEGDRRRMFPNLMTIAIERKQVLMPGETVSVRRTIDVGPLRDRVTAYAAASARRQHDGDSRSGADGERALACEHDRA